MTQPQRRTGRLVRASGDAGAGSVEYAGAVAVVAVVVAVLLGAAPTVGDRLTQHLSYAVCQVASHLPGGGGTCTLPAASTDEEGRTWTYEHIASGPMVMIGDSYGSGEGARDYWPETDNDPTWWDRLWGDESQPNMCHRSANAWGVGIGDAHWGSGSYSFQACSGATTQDVTAPNADNPGEGPQADAVTPDTTMIFVSMGGNDAGFAPILTECLAASYVNGQTRAQSQGMAPASAMIYCSDYYEQPEPGDPEGRTRRQVILDRVETRLRAMYAELADRSDGNAHIVQMGYPMLFDPGYLGLIEPQDVAYLNQLSADLNAVMAAVAAENGVHFIDPTEAFAEHGVGSDDPWILGLGVAGHHALPPEAFHPTADGQAAMQQLVEDYLQSLP